MHKETREKPIRTGAEICGLLGESDRKPCGFNARSNQWSLYDDTLAADLKLSIQNYFSRLRSLHNFNPLDVARSTDTSFAFALNGYGSQLRFELIFLSFLCA